MKLKLTEISEIRDIRNNLVNISLVVGTIAALPLIVSALSRLFFFEVKIFWICQAIIYLFVLVTTLYRRKISYNLKASVLILGMLSLAFLDFLETGFSGAAYIWLTASGITTSLFFDLKRTVYLLLFSVVAIGALFFFYYRGYVHFNFYGNVIHFPFISVLINTLLVLVIVLIISFAFRYVHQNLINNITKLHLQNEHLEDTTRKLQKEVEIRTRSEQMAINSEKNFRNVFEQGSDALLVVDTEGKILDFNEAFVFMVGLKEKDIFDPINRTGIPDHILKIMAPHFRHPETMPPLFDFEIDVEKEEKRYINCSVSLISYNEGKAFLFMIRDLTEKQNQDRENYRIAVVAEEKERSRFSKELHDGLGPLLSTLKIYLNLLYENPADTEIRERIDKTLSESIKTVKEISNNLSPYILENMGLQKALESFIERIKFTQRAEIKFLYTLTSRLAPEIEISLFRIITELINNTIKHSQATEIHLELNHSFESLNLFYADNGIGFDFDNMLLQRKGIGLFNLRSRVESMGGALSIDTSPGNGFSLNITLKTATT